ncbi:MAG: transcription elongation factor GreB [Deltaproteobacteria bacterium]|nr:transcription elongation factor GreB [Deltaproteobacteria bacterium]MBW2512495.1 transcription elongation factor GreB [Deltaproteobacteria bacterium]MDH4007257.1 transcription elongation factor GreB [Desulfuromonadales bacterium]
MSTDTPIYMTPACAKQMRAELKDLLYVKRPDTVRRVSDAAAEGDRSENAEYIYGKRYLRKIDSRIHFLTKRIENAEIVDPVAQGKTAAGRVLFGATVSVEDEEREKIIYCIVGVDEYNGAKGLVSWQSPIGMALMRKEVGDVAIVKTPSGTRELEILAIEYKPIPGVEIISRV